MKTDEEFKLEREYINGASNKEEVFKRACFISNLEVKKSKLSNIFDIVASSFFAVSVATYSLGIAMQTISIPGRIGLLASSVISLSTGLGFSCSESIIKHSQNKLLKSLIEADKAKNN